MVNSNFEVKEEKKSKWDAKFIDSVLKLHFLFDHLSDEERAPLIGSMKQVTFTEGEMFAKEGDVGECMYVIESGSVDEFTGDQITETLERGGVFGETCILKDSPRIHSFQAKTDVCLWELSRINFQNILAKVSLEEEGDMVALLRKVKFLDQLTPQQLGRIAESLTEDKFKKGDKIIKKGEKGTSFFILKDGSAKMHDVGHGDSQHVDQVLAVGDYFGARALLSGEARWMNVTCLTDCVVLTIERKTVEDVVGNIQKLLARAVKRRTLMSIPIFANSTFHSFEIEELVDAMTDVKFSAGEAVEDKDALYLIWSGVVRVANDNGMIFTLKHGDHFGGYNLVPSAEKADQRITVDEDALCRKLDLETIKGIIKNMARLGKPMPPVSSVFDPTIHNKDIEKKCVLGQGAFGKVWLVVLKRDNPPVPYALKTMQKKQICNPFEAAAVIMEKNIMASLDHPFCVRIKAAYQDDVMLYMLQPFLQGGELRTLVEKSEKGLDEPAAKFYAACILDGLNHMHKRDIVYRDMKPENVMIDGDGYAIVIDMGLSKVLKEAKSFTMCGTYPYMAPEFFLGKGHNQKADWWTFGVVVYELLNNRQPFTGQEKGLVKEIIGVRYRFIKGMNPLAKDLIKKLIQKNMVTRMGRHDVYDDPWFKDIDFEKLRNLEVKTPWKPEVKNPLDASSFGDFSKLEKENLNSMKIKPKDQVLFKDF